MFEEQLNKNKTLSIYGVQDISEQSYPEYVHDHNLTCFSNGIIKNYIHLERISRNKYDNSLHKQLYHILKYEKISKIKDLDIVFVDNVVGSSFISTKGDIRFEITENRDLRKGFYKGKARWFGEIKEAFCVSHELAHIYSNLPFHGPFSENSLHIHFDGGASQSNISVWVYKNNKMQLIDHHWRFKYLSSIFNANPISFGIIGADIRSQNSVAGKLMGFAAYGKYNEEIEHWLRKNEFFNRYWGKQKLIFKKIKKDFNIDLGNFNLKNNFVQDLAATMQRIFENDFILYLNEICRELRPKDLYFSGGSALNIPLNSRILQEFDFKNVFIPPCPNDSGLSIGAGAFIESMKGHKIPTHQAYLPSEKTNNYKVNCKPEVTNMLAKKLIDGKIIGVLNEHCECGPRALGNRSIIGLPTKETAKKISMEIKGREWYRPVAPIMLLENAEKIIHSPKIDPLSKLMLIEYKIDKKYYHEMPGVIHINGTSRVQIIFSRDENPFMYDLLKCLNEKHEVKALANTSFNSMGKPIVFSKKDAILAAKKMKLDDLIINGEFYI